jgi:hypothetical protein
MSTALATIESRGLAALRAKKRKHSDACIKRHVGILEQLAAANGGYVPTQKWLNVRGYFASYDMMCQYPAAFAHLKREQDKKFEIYKASNSGVPEILPPENKILAPEKYKTLAAYDVQGARFSPIELRINEGIAEQDWCAIGRALAHVCMSTFWWVGDWISYGKTHYGVKVSYDLAQQATAFSRNVLYGCVRVAKRFPPERRVEALTFYHHSVLCKFLPELADKLLAEAAEYGYTARQIRAMADEAVGKPKKNKSTVLSIRLPDYMFEELKQRASSPLRHFVPMIIIADWLRKKQEEENATAMAGIEA